MADTTPSPSRVDFSRLSILSAFESSEPLVKPLVILIMSADDNDAIGRWMAVVSLASGQEMGPPMKSVIATLATLSVLSGCTSKLAYPDLAVIYTRAARHNDGLRNPVIVIPGILGSKLTDTATGRVVWGAFDGTYANPETRDGAQLFALPMRMGEPLSALRDDVAPIGVLDHLRVNFAGLPIELSAYAQILATLGAGGYRDELLGQSGAVDYGDDHFTCFQFAYDWRRDIPENAARLHEFILEKKALVESEVARRFGIAKPDVKFNMVAHSMGGLLARYYLRYGAADLPDNDLPPLPTWLGHRYVENLICVGTPNAGSVKSLVQLIRGAEFSPVLPTYAPAVVGTIPAVYQLLPRPRHGPVVDAANTNYRIENLYDPDTWVEMSWGLANPRQDKVLQWLLPGAESADERREIAIDHLTKCLRRAERFHDALDEPAERPETLGMYLVVGDSIPTEAVIAADRNTGDVRVHDRQPGDGTVLRSSALMDERVGRTWSPRLRSPIDWTQVHFLFSDHLGMTRDPVFSDNVLYLLLESP